jgi:asparagine synthase (glutamine-hydrolysing)
MMAAQSSTPVRTFSVGFSEQKYSELAFASIVANRFGTRHNEVLVDPDLFMDQWPTAVLRRGAPVSEPADIPILVLSKLAGQSVKMVLTGEGSDELLGGYPKYRAERWIALYQRLMPQVVHRNFISPVVRSMPYAMRRAKIFTMAAGEPELINRMRVWFGGISIQERNALLGGSEPIIPHDSFPFSARSSSSVRRTLFFDQTSWLPDNLLERGDRMMMAGSIEGRMPFMDVELAALVARFPDKFLIGRKGGKVVLRAAMSRLLPPGILERKKVGFRVPVDQWFRGPYRSFIRENLLSQSAQITRICDCSVIEHLLNQHLDGRVNNEKVLWSLVNLELFLRTFKPSGVQAFREKAA